MCIETKVMSKFMKMLDVLGLDVADEGCLVGVDKENVYVFAGIDEEPVLFSADKSCVKTVDKFPTEAEDTEDEGIQVYVSKGITRCFYKTEYWEIKHEPIVLD